MPSTWFTEIADISFYHSPTVRLKFFYNTMALAGNQFIISYVGFMNDKSLREHLAHSSGVNATSKRKRYFISFVKWYILRNIAEFNLFFICEALVLKSFI